jgi:hypothetical protein
LGVTLAYLPARTGATEGRFLDPSGLDQNTVFAGLMGMTPSRAEDYRGRAEDCCRSAITAESVDRRLHWLEAAARWIRLAREESVLPPRQTTAAD